MHMVLEPDIGGYSVGSMMMAPAAQSLRVEGTMRFTCLATDPRGSWIESSADVVELTLKRQFLFHHRCARRRQHSASDDVADLPFRMRPHDCNDPARRRHHCKTSVAVAGSVGCLRGAVTRLHSPWRGLTSV